MFYLRENFIDRIVYQFDALPATQAKQLLLLSLPIWLKQKSEGMDYPNEWVVVHEALEEYISLKRTRNFLGYRFYIENLVRPQHSTKESIKCLIVKALEEYKRKHNDDSIEETKKSIKSSMALEANNLFNADGTLNKTFSKRLFG